MPFDAFGQLTSDGATTYSYDALGRLQNNGNGSNGLNQYAQAGLEPASDGSWNYARAPGDSSGPLAATPTAGGNPLSLQTNAHGDIIAGTNPKTGALAASRSYNAFGNVTASSGNLPNLGYQGSYTSPATGRTYAQSRWYDPTAGIFLSEDSAAPAAHNAVGTNLYAYAAANPTSAFDPSGHDCGLLSAVCDIWDNITQGLGDVADAGAKIIQEEAAYVDAGVGDLASFVAGEAVPVVEATGVALGEAAVEGAACVIGCAELAVGALVVVAIGGATYAFIVGAQALIYDGTYNPATGTVSSPATTTSPTAHPSVHYQPPSSTSAAPAAANQPPAAPPPPPPPHVTGTKTVTGTESWDNTSKWFDSEYLYTRVDHYSQTTTTVDTYWSDGRWYWKTVVSPVADTWTVTQQLLIDWSNPVQLPTPVVTAADNRAPQSGQGTAPVGTCGEGGNVLSCTATVFPTLPPEAQTEPAGQGNGRGNPPWKPTGCNELPRAWTIKRTPEMDPTKQGDLNPGEDIQPLQQGEKLRPGEYTFIVRLDGTLRAVNDGDFAWSREIGHTSLSEEAAVAMAGNFVVDENGNITGFDNLSGHYRPSDQYGTCSLEQISRDAFDSHNFPSPPEGAWNPASWPPSRSARDLRGRKATVCPVRRWLWVGLLCRRFR